MSGRRTIRVVFLGLCVITAGVAVSVKYQTPTGMLLGFSLTIAMIVYLLLFVKGETQ